MKLPDLVKQLANKINQPHVIQTYLRKVSKACYKKGYEDALKNIEEQCSKYSFEDVWNATEHKKPKEYFICPDCEIDIDTNSTKVDINLIDRCPKCNTALGKLLTK